GLCAREGSMPWSCPRGGSPSCSAAPAAGPPPPPRRPVPPPPYTEAVAAMLVLSRRPDEKILLPSVPAVIKVVSAAAGVVRLGIEAPAHVPILREEVRQKAPLEPEPPAETPTNPRQAARGRIRELGLGLALLRLQLSE